MIKITKKTLKLQFKYDISSSLSSKISKGPKLSLLKWRDQFFECVGKQTKIVITPKKNRKQLECYVKVLSHFRRVHEQTVHHL